MSHFEGSSTKVLLWSLLLQATMAFALQNAPVNIPQNFFRLNGAPATPRTLYEQYTLGQVEEGAKIICTYQCTKTFDEAQREISLDFHYPDLADGGEAGAEDGNSAIITQILLYVKAQGDNGTQAYITGGGIGEKNISFQIIASNSNLLNYMLVIYGKAA